MIVAFCGHNEVQNPEAVRLWLKATIQHLITQGATHFYSGGYGTFDRMVASVLKEEKQKHPHIESILILAYLDRVPDTDLYDDTLYPSLETVPKRLAIARRNQWMAENCDTMVAYVTHSWGGAAKTLECAKTKRKEIILFANQSS